MDALGLTYLANSPSKTEKKEQFNSDTSYSVVHFISVIISLVIGCIAATLSWNCNTSKGVNVGLKIIFPAFKCLQESNVIKRSLSFGRRGIIWSSILISWFVI